jgi:ABC-type transport system involved in multi-copper enzyme maturation permease subunit
MNVVDKLFAVEWMKMRRRGVFWVALLGQALILILGIGAQQYMHHTDPKRPAFTLPGDWGTLLDVGSQTGMLMVLIAVTLLTASEATWRTQRQNVIDGLSRAQYFSGKVLVVGIISVLLWINVLVWGMIVAPFGGAGSLAWPVFSDLAYRMLPNMLLYFIAMGSTALVFGMIASSSGAALAMMFAFLIMQPMLGGIMMTQGGVLPLIARYLPLDVFGNLVSKATYNAAGQADMNAVLVQKGLPQLLSLHTTVIVSILYIVAFIGLTWLAFRKRDL